MATARFAFGKNWNNYIKGTTNRHVDFSIDGVSRLLKRDDLSGLTFLDIGCGSGMSSVAAKRLGADVRAFDYDTDACETSKTLFEKFGVTGVELSQGSALDADFMRSLPTYDIVYSWGVLHHTGDMWKGLELAIERVGKGGICAISIYNDQGVSSKIWRQIKRLYLALPGVLRLPYLLFFLCIFEARSMLRRLINGKNPLPFADWKAKNEERGMSVWPDLVDWVGGYPFEVAKPEEIIDFFLERNFRLEYLTTRGGGHGCNEFMFKRVD